MLEKDNKRYRLREVNCPTGFNWTNLKAELHAVWESNVKDWKIEFAYPVSFVRQMISPLVFLVPFLIYGIVLVGENGYSENLAQLVGTGDVVTFIFTGYIMMGFIGTAVWAMGFSIRQERWFGTLQAIYVTPTSRLVQVMGMAIHMYGSPDYWYAYSVGCDLPDFWFSPKDRGSIACFGAFCVDDVCVVWVWYCYFCDWFASEGGLGGL